MTLGRPPETCPSCGRVVLTCTVLDPETRKPTDTSVTLDPVPSLHGYYQRPLLYAREVIEREDRAPGRFRPHVETCQGAGT